MYHLPNEIIRLIYSWDSTYHICFKLVMIQIRDYKKVCLMKPSYIKLTSSIPFETILNNYFLTNFNY